MEAMHPFIQNYLNFHRISKARQSTIDQLSYNRQLLAERNKKRQVTLTSSHTRAKKKKSNEELS